MSGEQLMAVLMALIVALQAIAVALIQRGRKADKEERAIVAERVQETAIVAADTKAIAQSSHDIANSRYDELKNELRLANERVGEQNEQIINLLRARNREVRTTDGETMQSSILAREGYPVAEEPPHKKPKK